MMLREAIWKGADREFVKIGGEREKEMMTQVDA